MRTVLFPTNDDDGRKIAQNTHKHRLSGWRTDDGNNKKSNKTVLKVKEKMKEHPVARNPFGNVNVFLLLRAQRCHKCYSSAVSSLPSHLTAS